MKWGLTKRNDSINSDLDLFRKNITSFFDDFFNVETTGFFENDLTPAVDVHEDEKGIYVKADLPGLDEKDLKVELHNNLLTISGEKKEERREESKDKRTVFSERRYGSFTRSIGLPEGIKTDSIKAEYKNGVLNITVPRDKKIEETKKIKINIQ